MKPCRWCGQPIEPLAQKCQHCGTWQRDGADLEAARAAQILDKGFLYWAKFMVGVAALLTAVLVAAGGLDIYHVSERVRDALSAARTSQGEAADAARKAKSEAELATLEARNLLADAKEKVDKMLADEKIKLVQLEQEVSKQRTLIDQQFEYITGRASSVQNDPTQIGDSLKNHGDAISELQRQVAALQEKAAAVGAPPQPAQIKEDQQRRNNLEPFLQIEQTAKKVDRSGAAGDRQSYDVTFRLCSFFDNKCGKDHLGEVFRVVYRFNDKWFSVPDVPVVNSANQFSYTVRVWGVTRVGACIFVIGALNQPIARAHPINLAEEPTYWGPDPTAKDADCGNLKI